MCFSEDSDTQTLHQLGLPKGTKIIGTRLVDEHHQVHDYPEEDDHDDNIHHDDSDSDDDYHNPIYDHVQIDKDDYDDFGETASFLCCGQSVIRVRLSIVC